MTQRGGLGSALTAHSQHDKPVGLLIATVIGRSGLFIPWQPFLAEAEAEWVVDQLLRGVPE